MSLLKSVHERDALVEVLRFKLDKVEPSAQLCTAGFVGEIDELGKGATNLERW